MNHLDTHCSGGIKLMNERNMNGYIELKGYISLKNKPFVSRDLKQIFILGFNLCLFSAL